MYSLKIISSSALVVFIIIATTEGKPAKDNQDILNIQACGKDLADLLASTCHLGYNIQTKTFVPSASVDESSKENNSVDNAFNNISQEKPNVHKRSIIQECCIQPCRWHDLLAYCYNGSTMTIESLIDRLKTLGVKVIIESPYTVIFHRVDSTMNMTCMKNSTDTEIKINEVRLSSEDSEGIGNIKTIPNTPEKSENITSDDSRIKSRIRSITPYYYHKTPIILDNRTVTMQSQPQV